MDTGGLSAICNGLGYRREDEDGTLLGYIKGEYCLDNLKDLQRFLRRDDPNGRDVFKQICKWNVVSLNLIPLMENYQNDSNLVINGVKILVFLTMPVDPASDNISQQIEYLWHLKAAITRNTTIAVIVSLLEDPLEHLEREAFTEDDWKLVQLILTLFRNILAIQDILLQQKASGSSTQFLHLRDRFLELLFQENVMDLILVLTQHVDGSCGHLRQDNLLLLEIFHYIFQGQEPELVAEASCKGSEVDGGIDTSLNSLKAIMEEEQEKRRLARLRSLECHSQFSGTFTRLAMDGSRTLFKGNPTTASGNSMLKAPKVQRGPLKRIAWDHGSLSVPENNILELLNNFLNQFLSGGYNVLMQSIREDIEKEHPAIQNSDVIIFFQVACFITAFQHHKFSILKHKTNIITPEASPVHKVTDSSSFHGDVCGPIAITMNEAMFFLVISKWRYAFDSLKETNDYKCLSSAGSLMKNMIRMLDLVLTLLPEDSNEPKTARILLYKLFYDQTDQGMTQFLLTLVKSFDTHKQPKSDLADLVEIIHKVVRLVENLQERGTLRVSRKLRKRRKQKILGEKHEVEAEKLREEHTSSQTADGLNQDNGLSSESLVYLDKSLKEHFTNSVSVGKEGTTVPNPTGEPGIHLPDRQNLGDDSANMDGEKSSNDHNDLTFETGDSSNDEHLPDTNEGDFNVTQLISSFASNAVIQKLCWLLKFYKSNSASINHYIVSMLQRISDDLELSPMLYQLSVLTIFYDILDDQKSSKCKEYTNIVKFLTKFVRNMLKKMKCQPLLFVEILFWKTRKECHYINAEGLIHDIHNLRREIKSWPGGEIGLTNGIGRASGKSIADSLGEDEADIFISHDLNYQKDEASDGNLQNILHKTNGSMNDRNIMVSTSNTVINGKRKFKLSNQQSEESYSDDHSQIASRRKKCLVFDQEQEMMIKNLYEKHKDDRRCSRLIAEALAPHGKVSAIQVSCKLKQLGLKVAPRKKITHVDQSFHVGDDQTGVNGKPFPSDTSPNSSSKLEDNSFLKPSYHTRKRIQAFSKEQELMVKTLFEQFKDHKRCSHMIANALDADNRYTAAQVSRKLKQLGLHVPRDRRPAKAAKHSGDEEISDKEDKSDEETLLVLLERSKSKKRKLQTKEVTKTSTYKPTPKVTVVQEDVSDHEMLSSMIEVPRAQYKSKSSRTTGDVAVDISPLGDIIIEEKDGEFANVGSEDGQSNPQMHDELADLADSGDDVGPTAPKNIGFRRKLKMVIDVEDDD